jgi:hypothetical protein
MRASGQLHAQSALPPYSTEQEAGWEPQSVWEEKSLLLPLLYSPSCPAHGLVTMPTELSGAAHGLVTIPTELSSPAHGLVTIPTELSSPAHGLVTIPTELASPAHGLVTIPTELSSPAHGLVTIPTELFGCGSETKTKGNRGRKKYLKTEDKVRENVKE